MLPSPSISPLIFKDGYLFDSALQDEIDARLDDMCSRFDYEASQTARWTRCNHEPAFEEEKRLVEGRNADFGDVPSGQSFSSKNSSTLERDMGFSDITILDQTGRPGTTFPSLNSLDPSCDSQVSASRLASLHPHSTSLSFQSYASSEEPSPETLPLKVQLSQNLPRRSCLSIPQMPAFKCSSCQRLFASKARLA